MIRGKILAASPPASEADIQLARARYGELPADYVELVRYATQLEMLFDDEQYLRVWGPLGTIDQDDGYSISKRIRGAIPFGDDGGGRFLFFGVGDRGQGVYLCGYGSIAQEDAIWIATSLSELLTDPASIDRL